MMTRITDVDEDVREGIRKARRARAKSYSEYSGFSVGACLFADGEYYTGTNIEIGGRSQSIHAEMLAIFNAVMDGKTDFDFIAVSCDGQSGDVMCSLCQHVMAEFDEDVIIACDMGDMVRGVRLKDELGDAFRPGENR